MSHPELEGLTRAEQLFDDGKLDEALEIFYDINQYEGLDFQQITHFQFLTGLLLAYQNKSEELIDLGERMYEEGQKLKEYLHSIDGFFLLLMGLSIANKFEEALNKFRKADVLFDLISNVPKKILSKREARISVLKAFISYYTGNIESAEKDLEELLHIEEENNTQFEIVWANVLMIQIEILIRRRSDVAMGYAKRAMSLAKKIKYNHYWIGLIHIGIGVIHSYNCEYDLCFEHHMKSLAIFKGINNNWYIAILLNNLGNFYCEKGDFDIALKYLEESLILLEPNSFLIEACLDSLIYVALEKGDAERVQKYFHRLEIMHIQNKNNHLLALLYQYNKALMLKTSSRIRDIAKAEEILKELIKTEFINYDFTIYAYIHLCDITLAEFRISNNREALDELNH